MATFKLAKTEIDVLSAQTKCKQEFISVVGLRILSPYTMKV
jgi:hypothetical protein